MFKFLFPLLFAVNTYAGQIGVVGPYKGLNDTDSAVTLADGEAQDLLNVEVSKDGQSVLKRAGYSQINILSVATAPIRGSALFTDTNNNEIEVFASGINVYSSINGGSYNAIVTTATLGAKWSFCEAAGIIYAFNDQHDIPFSYDGTTVVRYNDASIMPRASICAMTPTRMLLAGTTDYPNRLYWSEEGNYDNFTLGIETNDPSFDDIGMAGDKITGLWANASEWLIWKTNSMMSYQGTNQYDLVASIISGRVGLSDPQARLEHGGVIYFKGTDSKIWAYSGGMLTDTTKKLDVFTSSITKGNTLNNQYSESVDFSLGTFYDTYSEDGEVLASTWTLINSTRTALFSLNNMGAELADWNGASGWISNGGAVRETSSSMWGSYIWNYVKGNSCTGATANNYIKIFFVENGSSTVAEITSSSNTTATFSATNGYDNTFDFDLTASTHNYIAFYIVVANGGSSGSALSYKFPRGDIYRVRVKVNTEGTTCVTRWDIDTDSNTVYGIWNNIFNEAYTSSSTVSGTYTSEIIDSKVDSPNTYLLFNASTIAPSGTSINFYVRDSTASDNGGWTDWVAASDSLKIPLTHRYCQYKADFATNSSSNTAIISSVTLSRVTTGYWESNTITLSPMTNWGIFYANETTQNNLHWTYQIKTSTWSNVLEGASYSSVSTGTLISISTGTYFKIKAINSFATSTETVKLNSINYAYTYYSANGSDLMASGFEYLGDIFFAVPYNGSTTNNRVMKYDMQSQGWTIFDIPMNAPIISGNSVHFGSPTNGNIYTYPSGNNDAGSAISAYWQSKDYMGDNAYVTKTYDKLSLFMDSDYSSDIDLTYNIEPSTSITRNITLTQSDGSKYIRNNHSLPTGTNGSIINLKIANNAVDKPFRFYGSVIDYTNDGWVVYP